MKLLARIYTVRFIKSNSKDDSVQIRTKLLKLEKKIEEAEDEIDNDDLIDKLEDAIALSFKYSKAVNETITVIDKIAFQTNILSLNVAVEAATVGEAGKGFAIVAQEVRNLASRTTDAANEIKILVKNATVKADTGKSIAKNMISGYDNLKDNISKTIELISDIEVASQEQQQGIEQINSSITLLDSQTQKNASIAQTTKEIAVKSKSIAKTIVEHVFKE
ncbi:MAG: hypothetical protein GY932_06975 [Arcobacter sp.]|nr:hypothetical protein [Arcobacter sp.]